MAAENGQNLMYERGALILAAEGHCDWEDVTAETFDKVGVPYYKFIPDEVRARFPQFKVDEIKYALFEPEAGLLMAHRCVITALKMFKDKGGVVKRGTVTTDAQARPMLGAQPIRADLIVNSTGPSMSGMFPRRIKPTSAMMGISVFYTSTLRRVGRL